MYVSRFCNSIFVILLTLIFSQQVQSQCPINCFIPCDSTFQVADLTGTGSFACDDCSSSEIQLPFDYSFCGTIYNSLWINSNGNVTFDGPYATFTPVGMPNNVTAVMAAPFWADVDLGSGATCGNVCYKIDSNKMIINWEEVGYFPGTCDAPNTFQLIITDGTDASIGIGNNTSFNYAEMGWTTGGASGGYGGFGGANATVGINGNNAIDFGLIGEFNFFGDQPPTLDSLGGSVTAGQINWLDNVCFSFNAFDCYIDSDQDDYISAGGAIEIENFYAQDSIFSLEACGTSVLFPTVGSSFVESYFLISNLDSTIHQISDDTCFDIEQFGSFSMYAFVYDSLTYNTNSVILDYTTLPDLIVSLNDNSICYDINDGDDFVVAYCNTNDGSIATSEMAIDSDSVFLNSNIVTICADIINPSTVPAGFIEVFFLTLNDTIIDAGELCYNINSPGDYVIYSLVFQPFDFYISGNITTYNELLFFLDNYATSCYAFDSAGLAFQVLPCQAATSNLTAPIDSILVGDTLCLNVDGTAVIPTGFVELFYLVKDEVIIDIVDAGCIALIDTGTYSIYALVINSADTYNSLFYEFFPHTMDQFSNAFNTLNYCYAFNEIGTPFNAYEAVINLQESSNDFDISFYPNPVKDKLNIDFENYLLDYLRIYSSEGKLVSIYKQNLSGTRSFNLEHLNAGIYFLEFVQRAKKMHKKIVVE